MGVLRPCTGFYHTRVVNPGEIETYKCRLRLSVSFADDRAAKNVDRLPTTRLSWPL
jgi:hypothetical protein